MGAAVEVVRGDCRQQLAAIVRGRQEACDRNNQQLAAQGELGCAMAVCQKTEVAYALETGRQRVDEEAPDELVGVHRHDLRVLHKPPIRGLAAGTGIRRKRPGEARWNREIQAVRCRKRLPVLLERGGGTDLKVLTTGAEQWPGLIPG